MAETRWFFASIGAGRVGGGSKSRFVLMSKKRVNAIEMEGMGMEEGMLQRLKEAFALLLRLGAFLDDLGEDAFAQSAQESGATAAARQLGPNVPLTPGLLPARLRLLEGPTLDLVGRLVGAQLLLHLGGAARQVRVKLLQLLALFRYLDKTRAEVKWLATAVVCHAGVPCSSPHPSAVPTIQEAFHVADFQAVETETGRGIKAPPPPQLPRRQFFKINNNKKL